MKLQWCHIAVVAFVLMFGIASTACGNKDTSCKGVVDHTISLLSGPAKASATKDRQALIKKCQETSEEERECVLAAKSDLDFAKCAKSKAKKRKAKAKPDTK